MSELREAAKEALRWMEHARLHLTIKERMHPDGLSLYDSAAEALRAALAQPETEAQPVVEPVAWEARWNDPEEGASYWVPTQNPDFYRSRPNYEVRSLYAHPPRDEWREAVHDELVTTWTFSAENKDDPRKALQDIINWHVRVALDPAVSSDAQALIERGKAMRDEWRPASEPPEDGRDVVVWCAQERRAVHGMYVRRHPPVVGLVDGWVAPDASKLTHWRDVTPPTESPIAAKCQRIEGSGEICGLTPPCPDCGSSLIDVAEGAL